MTWQPIETSPLNVPVETKIHDDQGERNHAVLKGVCREPGVTRTMWFVPDGSMYVYYQPTHWRPVEEPDHG